MAIFHLTVKTGSRLGGQSARAKADYIEREGKYERQDDELAHRESENMPEWAEDDPRSYWEAADEHERVNGRLFREVEFALPRELNEGDQVELAREFASKLTSAGGERLPYTLAVHRGQGENPHAHLMISERANDGIERSREQWFKRYNSKEPEKGGARKSMATRPKDWLEQTRKDWADHANQALARVGSREKITGASLEQQYRDALEAGDEREAARLEYREPGVHIGPHNVARAERGVALERPATARAVEDRNQAFKSDRADVREMEGSLERLRGDIAEVVRKLAVYVRARLERSRGRSGPDRLRRSPPFIKTAGRSWVEPIMANALDRVKAAEAKYTAMAETAEKLESTLKNFKGTADLCYAAMRELHREIKKDQKDQRWAFWLFVLMAVNVAVVGGIFGNFLREAAVRILDALGAWWGS